MATALMVNAQRKCLISIVAIAASVVLAIRNESCNSWLRVVDYVTELLPTTLIVSGRDDCDSLLLTYLLFHHTYMVSWVDVWGHWQAFHRIVRALWFRRMPLNED